MNATTETFSRPYPQRRARDLAEPMPQRPVAVRLHGLEKSFGAHTVLRGIDLDIPSGQFVAIVGRSGCGKSTLLRLLAGLDTPSAGHIGIGRDDNTRNENGTPDAARPNAAPDEHVRLMFQEPRLLPWARVGRNVEVGLTRAEDAPTRRRLAHEALARVGLADRADDWPAVLSGGQQQRVALARALVSRPWLLALDEPLGALDALTRLGMQELIEDVWRAQRFTAVLVTHDVAEAVTLADRVLALEDGRITADIAVDLPRPRRGGDPVAARIGGHILDHLLRHYRSV
ncbi:MAG TPA: ATP-binding cassette domain-containing protein [Acetobacteraceae bacterium]|jgi:sulfonate transport system ATP-binding protein|nr:ATP-binding cassette domain-containing protein [Acetobacteraceae bacterium]